MKFRNPFTALLRASAAATTPAAAPSTLAWSAEVDIKAADGDGDTPATFSIAAYTGGTMRLPGIYLPVVIELSGVRTTAGQVKILREHDPNRVLGHADTVEVTSQGIFVTGTFSGEDAEVAKVTGPSQRGFQWEASVGAKGETMERLEAGATTTVNGRTVTGPLFIARKSALKEVSFVAIGADEHTTTSIAAADPGDTDMNFEQWLKAHGFDPATINDTFKTAMKAQYEADLRAAGGDPSQLSVPTTPQSQAQANGQQPSQSTAQQPQNMQGTGTQLNGQPNGQNSNVTDLNASSSMSFMDALQQFREDQVRVERIRATCREHNHPRIEANGQQVDLAAHAISSGMSVNDVELHCLRASRPQAPAGIVRGDMEPALQASALEASLCRSAGIASDFLEKQYDERTLTAADHRDLRGAGLQQLIHTCISLCGGYAVPGRMSLDTIQSALRLDPALNGSNMNASGLGGLGGYSTVSLSGILSNVANKAMLERFDTIDSVIPEIFYETDTNDFKPFNRFRLHADGQFSEVGADGKLKSISLQEQEFTNRLKTQGASLALTREHITNDDMNAFLEMFRLFAELAMHAREEAGLKLTLSNPGSFFHNDNSNFMTGAASALSHAALSTAVSKFRKLKDPNGKFIMVRPSILFVPPALETEAEELYTSIELRGQSAKGGTRNTHHNKYRPVVSPHIGDDALPGGSDKAWYLLAAPQTSRAIAQMAYLRGRRTPTVESANALFSVGGIEWAGYWDFGAAMQDKEAGVKAKGEN